MIKKMMISFALLLSGIQMSYAANPGIIPVPQSCVMKKGTFTFDAKTNIYIQPDNAEMRVAVALIQHLFRESAGFSPDIAPQTRSSNIVVCRIKKDIKQPEAYELNIKPNRIEINAGTPTGIFYALQTLRQLLPPEIDKAGGQNKEIKWSVQAMSVSDSPRFSYRGMMLDVCRHFMPKEFIFRYIDMLAFHKLNTFHWHLTDDQGWRIEIKKYPKLTEIGAFRRMEIDGHKNAPDWKWKVVDHGGYYTQEEIREVVDYAKKRFVTIVPEIEIPGHALAALSAYPELSCSGGPFEVVGRWGVFHDIFCSREETMIFLENVLTEVAALFPGEYIHLGGDEAPKTRWKRCKACQDRMAAEGLKNETQLQTYILGRMEKFLKEKGKKVICWDDAADADISKTVTVMSWRSEDGGISGAKRGNDVIMTPHKSVYFDYYQGDKNTEPLTIGGFLPLEKVYEFSPVPEILSKDEAARIKGTQANVWTEYMPDEKRVEYMVFPRIAALAEVSWSLPANKNLADFRSRLKNIIQHYDCMNINYRKSDN